MSYTVNVITVDTTEKHTNQLGFNSLGEVPSTILSRGIFLDEEGELNTSEINSASINSLIIYQIIQNELITLREREYIFNTITLNPLGGIPNQLGVNGVGNVPSTLLTGDIFLEEGELNASEINATSVNSLIVYQIIKPTSYITLRGGEYTFNVITVNSLEAYPNQLGVYGLGEVPSTIPTGNIFLEEGELNATEINVDSINSLIVYQIIQNNPIIIGVSGITVNSLTNLVDYYYWDFGDPNSNSNLVVVNGPLDNMYYHQYSQSGTYTIKLVEVRKDGIIIENSQTVNI